MKKKAQRESGSRSEEEKMVTKEPLTRSRKRSSRKLLKTRSRIN
jgi:hypothetical protein